MMENISRISMIKADVGFENPNDGECWGNVEGLQPIHAPDVMFLNCVNGIYTQQLRKCCHLKNGDINQTQGHILTRQQWLQLLKIEFESESEQSLLQALQPQELQQLLQELLLLLRHPKPITK